MRWVLWFLWNPLSALDLVDGRGKPDHGKVMGFVGFVGLYGLAIILVWRVGYVPPVAVWLILGTLPFGLIAWRILLRSKAITSAETVTHTITEAIASRRKIGADDGTEPTP